MAAGVRGAVAGELSQEERLRQRCERAGVSMHMLVLLLLPVVDAFYTMSILIVLMCRKMLLINA